MYGCEMWAIKKAEHWRIDALELWCWRRLENPLDSKEIKPVNPKGNQPWVFIGRTDAEIEAPILWPLDGKSQLIGANSFPWCRERLKAGDRVEDEMVGWHHRLNGHESEETLGDSEGQGSLACCSPWDCKELDRTEWLNNIKVLSHGSSGYFLNRYISVIFYCLV